MKAREPDRAGFLDRDGVRLWYEVHGDAETTLLLLPGWSLPLRAWKAQIPYLARHFRVVAFDPRGTGQSDRPRGAAAYTLAEHTADALAVMDAVGARSVVAIGKSRGAQTGVTLAVDHPERVTGLVVAAPMIPLSPWPPLDTTWTTFEKPGVGKRRRSAVRGLAGVLRQLPTSPDLRLFARKTNALEAANRFSRQFMNDDFDGFAQWFVSQLVATDPHSTKQTEDLIGWLLDVGPQAAADSFIAPCVREPIDARALCDRISCPVLVIHGDRDLTVPFDWGRKFAELTGGRLLTVPGAGHLPGVRYPVMVNLAIREFVDSLDGREDRAARDQTGAAR